MRILLHICCAPCACYTVKRLLDEGHNVVGFWFNPNLHPYKEYLNRLKTLKLFADRTNLDIVVRDFYGLLEFVRLVAGNEEYGKRCEFCYLWRLKETARYALEHGFDAFTTTLLYSKYQDHEAIKNICERVASEMGMRFYYVDFREGWFDGIEISKRMGLYRQNYCGCIFSEKEAMESRMKSGDI